MSDVSETQAYGQSMIGQVLDGRFEIVRLLGSGGMGQIYLAEQRGLGALRAIKVIKSDIQSDPEVEARFRREARTMSRLTHTKIVSVIDFGRLAEDVLYLVLEYVEGPNLHQVVQQRGPLPLVEALEVLDQLAAGLEYAHGQGIVHRDLKPENIIVQGGDHRRLKIIDFGLAKLVGGEDATQITKADQILGTPLFMAPEQCNAEVIGPGVDLYALGGVGYFLLSGRPVFQGNTVMSMIVAHTFQIPERLSARCPPGTVPSELDALLLRCLEKDPAKRPSAAGFAEGLADVMARLKAPPRPVRRTADVSPPTESDLAARIWEEPSAAHGSAASSEEEVSYREAVFNQLTAVLLDLAQDLQAHLNVSASINVQMSQIDRISETLTNLEMDVALMDSQLEELAGQVPEEEARLRRQVQLIRSQALELSAGLNREYRVLFRYVTSCRSEVTDPALLALYDELDALVEQYLQQPA